ncbi:nuclear polyadenylated RNA-binding protein 3 [Penicillium rubens]|nr:nuclear polyadenylated RNA-binding protein 3 [Penicillium rubens]
MSAELLSYQAQATQRGAAPVAFATNPFGITAMSPMPILQPNLPAPCSSRNLANLIYWLDGPSVLSLLSATQRTPYSQPVPATQSPFSSSNPPPPTDLASLLANANRRQLIPTPTQQSIPPCNPKPPNAPVATDPNLLSLLARGLGG